MSGVGKLKGRVAIITGAGQGIGEAIARRYAREGAKIVITGRTLSKLEDVAAKIQAEEGEVRCLDALAGNREHAEKTVAVAIAAWGRVDVLVNNAHTFTDFMAMEDPKLEDNIRIDMNSAFIGSLQLMQCAFPHMRDIGGGSIINFGSSYGIRCEPGFLAYAAAKKAIRTLTRTAAREWGKHKIRVNTILPSAMSPKALGIWSRANPMTVSYPRLRWDTSGSRRISPARAVPGERRVSLRHGADDRSGWWQHDALSSWNSPR